MKPRGAIGVRELKIHASRVLRRVRQSKESVPITHRGEVVAHLLPAEEYERLKSGRADYWEALRAFRQSNDTSELGDVFAGVRETSKGRKFSW
jgi:prevent-host-death family protein